MSTVDRRVMTSLCLGSASCSNADTTGYISVCIQTELIWAVVIAIPVITSDLPFSLLNSITAESLTNHNEAELQRRCRERQQEIDHMEQVLETKIQLLQEVRLLTLLCWLN